MSSDSLAHKTRQFSKMRGGGPIQDGAMAAQAGRGRQAGETQTPRMSAHMAQPELHPEQMMHQSLEEILNALGEKVHGDPSQAEGLPEGGGPSGRQGAAADAAPPEDESEPPSIREEFREEIPDSELQMADDPSLPGEQAEAAGEWSPADTLDTRDLDESLAEEMPASQSDDWTADSEQGSEEGGEGSFASFSPEPSEPGWVGEEDGTPPDEIGGDGADREDESWMTEEEAEEIFSDEASGPDASASRESAAPAAGAAEDSSTESQQFALDAARSHALNVASQEMGCTPEQVIIAALDWYLDAIADDTNG